MKMVQHSPLFIHTYLALAAYSAPVKPVMKEIENTVGSNLRPVENLMTLLSFSERRMVYPVAPDHFNDTDGSITRDLQISSSKFTSSPKPTFNSYSNLPDAAIGKALDRRTPDLQAAAPSGEGDGQSFTGVAEGIELRATSDLIDINIQFPENSNYGAARQLDLRTTDPEGTDPDEHEERDPPVSEEVDALVKSLGTAASDAPVGGLSGLMKQAITTFGRSVGFSRDSLDGNRDAMGASNLKDSMIPAFARALAADNGV